MRRNENGQSDVALTVGAVVGILLLVLLCFGLYVGIKAVGRTQALADARNRVRISQIEIRNQSQRVQIAKQKAEVRREDAIGVRHAQDEIAKTLTPLYVQFEMVEALKAIAKSGRNSSVVYLPSGANGIPLVSTVDPAQVGQPDAG